MGGLSLPDDDRHNLYGFFVLFYCFGSKTVVSFQPVSQRSKSRDYFAEIQLVTDKSNVNECRVLHLTSISPKVQTADSQVWFMTCDNQNNVILG